MRRFRLAKTTLAVLTVIIPVSSFATPILFEVTSSDCTALNVQLERPFDVTCLFTDLPTLVGTEVTLFSQAVGDINGADEFLRLDADGFPLTLFGDSATVVQVFSTNSVELYDEIVSQSFLPDAISDGTLLLRITGSQAVANITISELGLRYLVEPTSVPEPGTLALFTIGLFGMGLSRKRKANS